MQDIVQNIREYEESRNLLQKRIHELNEKINNDKSHKEDSLLRGLLERRTMLYTQIWDIEFAIRSLREYADHASPREVDKKVG